MKLPATPANIKYAARLRSEVINQIERQTFDYSATFPNSKSAKAARVGPLLVEDLVADYMDTARALKVLSPTTILTNASRFRARILPKWGKVDARTITTSDVRRWVVKDLAPNLAPGSVRACITLLSVLLSRAVADGLLNANPLFGMERRSVVPRKDHTSEDTVVDPFNDTEIATILKACATTEERALWAFAFSSGLRTGELLGLRWEHVNEAEGYVRIQDNIVSGEDGPVLKSTKTDRSRVLPLLPAARDALAALPRGSGRIFICPLTTRPWTNDRHICRYWRRTLKTAGVRYRYPYQTRHTFASKLLELGESVTLVANLLGHSTTAMVIQHYGRYIKKGLVPKLSGDYSNFATAPNEPQIK